VLTNTAAVSGGGQVNTANDSDSDLTTVNQLPDLTINKSHTGNFTQGQTGATYTITATNSGFAATSGTVTVTDTLPAGLTATAISGTGWTCVLGTLTCTRSDALAVGASYPVITVTVNVANNAAASVTNTAAVSGGGQTNTTNDSDTDSNDGYSTRGLNDCKVTCWEFHTGPGRGRVHNHGNELGLSRNQRHGDRDRHFAGGTDSDGNQRYWLDLCFGNFDLHPQ